MSYVEAFVIGKDGEVLSYGEAKNNHGFAPMVWERLADRFGLTSDGRFFFLSDEVMCPLGAMAGTGEIPLEDDLLLQSTFDYVMIPMALVPSLIKRMRTFYETELKPRNIVKTIPQLADLIEKAIKEYPDDLGICFNCCSANESYWWVRSQARDEGGDDDSHPRNILTEPGKAEWLDAEYFKALVQGG